jgi:hypothetical protein
MNKDRAQRYQTMAELDADLARLESGLTPRARTLPPLLPQARKRWPQIAAWLIGLGGLAAAVAAVVPRLLANDEPPRSEPAQELHPALARSPMDSPPAPAAPEKIHAKLTSHPAGAEVWWESVKLGQTPLDFDVPRGSDLIELVLKHDGYEDAKAKFYPTEDQPVDVTLTPRPAAKVPPHKQPPHPAAADTKPVDRGPTSGGEIKGNPFPQK